MQQSYMSSIYLRESANVDTECEQQKSTTLTSYSAKSAKSLTDNIESGIRTWTDQMQTGWSDFK